MNSQSVLFVGENFRRQIPVASPALWPSKGYRLEQTSLPSAPPPPGAFRRKLQCLGLIAWATTGGKLGCWREDYRSLAKICHFPRCSGSPALHRWAPWQSQAFCILSQGEEAPLSLASSITGMVGVAHSFIKHTFIWLFFCLSDGKEHHGPHTHTNTRTGRYHRIYRKNVSAGRDSAISSTLPCNLNNLKGNRKVQTAQRGASSVHSFIDYNRSDLVLVSSAVFMIADINDKIFERSFPCSHWHGGRGTVRHWNDALPVLSKPHVRDCLTTIVICNCTP